MTVSTRPGTNSQYVCFAQRHPHLKCDGVSWGVGEPEHKRASIAIDLAGDKTGRRPSAVGASQNPQPSLQCAPPPTLAREDNPRQGAPAATPAYSPSLW
jgi:hypothetical protein